MRRKKRKRIWIQSHKIKNCAVLVPGSADVDEQAREMFSRLVEQMAEKQRRQGEILAAVYLFYADNFFSCTDFCIAVLDYILNCDFFHCRNKCFH